MFASKKSAEKINNTEPPVGIFVFWKIINF